MGKLADKLKPLKRKLGLGKRKSEKSETLLQGKSSPKRLKKSSTEVKLPKNEDLSRDYIISDLSAWSPRKKSLSKSSIANTNKSNWISLLNLTTSDKALIKKGYELTDTIIDAAQRIMKWKFNANGLDSCLLSSTSEGFKPCSAPAVQIHYDNRREHWITSALSEFGVEVCDSMKSDITMTDSLAVQLVQRYRNSAINNKLQVSILPVDQQHNSVDCGVYAIAYAVEYLTPKGDPTAKFDPTVMRSHLISCFESMNMTPFPKTREKAVNAYKLQKVAIDLRNTKTHQ